MIVCSCNVISDHDIRAAVLKIMQKEEDTLVTIGKVYKSLGKKTVCTICLKNAIQIMTEEVEAEQNKQSY